MEKSVFEPRLSQQVSIQLEQPHPPVTSMPRDYLVLSLITLLCCFFPVGIFALIQSLKVSTARTLVLP
jgi:hypothetical protein